VIGTLPAWVGDLGVLCGAAAGVGVVVGLVLKMAKPGFNQAVGEALQPRFDELHTALTNTQQDLTVRIDTVRVDLSRRIDDSNARLDAHMRVEERHAESIDRALGEIAGRILRTEVRVDDHLAHHPGGPADAPRPPD
jgi:hypothetical protein